MNPLRQSMAPWIGSRKLAAITVKHLPMTSSCPVLYGLATLEPDVSSVRRSHPVMPRAANCCRAWGVGMEEKTITTSLCPGGSLRKGRMLQLLESKHIEPTLRLCAIER